MHVALRQLAPREDRKDTYVDSGGMLERLRDSSGNVPNDWWDVWIDCWDYRQLGG